MSVAAHQYGPAFSHHCDMGGRPFFAWPDIVLNSTHDTFPSQELGPYASNTSLSPPRQHHSIANSPPRMTPEQDELERQGGHDDMEPPPPHMANNVYTTGTSSLPSTPVYTTAPSGFSLLTEPTTLALQLVLPPSSPPLPSPNSMLPHSPPLSSSTSTIFPSPYQPPAVLPEYPYTPSLRCRVSSHYGPMSHKLPLMYSIPYIMQPSSAPHHHAEGPSAVRIVQSRPKPQCWAHGCNGRQFSTFSNFLRHQREKSVQAAKATCPTCGAEFTRTTARNVHLRRQKCKRREKRGEKREK